MFLRSESKRLLADAKAFSQGKGGSAVVEIAEKRLWENYTNGQGERFESFSEFVLSSEGDGLGLSTQKQFELLHMVLVRAKLYHVWASVWVRVAAKRGRPSKNKTGGTNSPYSPIRGGGAVDRMLSRLADRYPEKLDQLVKGEVKYEELVPLVQQAQRPKKPAVERIRELFEKLDAREREAVLGELLEKLPSPNLASLYAALERSSKA